ncbi:MAG: hypothetical protein IT434_04840 [Phycisphaerales bacterium]|jgi:nitrate reductase cytochrome c-type subunit|nr:hypothetical protein [Phycisphaerales bacterium]
MEQTTRSTRVGIVTITGAFALAAGAAVASFTQPPTNPLANVPVPKSPQAAYAPATATPTQAALPWKLNNPAPNVVPDSRANPAAVADKFNARIRSIEQRAKLRAFEGAPPVVPHATTDMNVQTCRACHGQGLRAGDKTARMMAHASMTSCTQCHVEAENSFLPDQPVPPSTFVGYRSSGYGGTRAWAGAPPVMPHPVFMRTNCVACHGEFGYDGWRPDHLSRTNCFQCHAPAAEYEQLSPTFNTPDVPDGTKPPSIP